MQTEYDFILTAQQSQELADTATHDRLARFDRSRDRLDAAFGKLIPMVALLPLPLLGLALYLVEQRFRIEEALGLLLAGCGCYAAWRSCSERLITHLQNRRAAIRNVTRNILARTLENSYRRSLKRLEGLHSFRIEQVCLTIRSPRNRVARIPWRKVSRIRESKDFYLISTLMLGKPGRCHLVAKHSSLMGPNEYDNGLKRMLMHIPAAAWN